MKSGYGFLERCNRLLQSKATGEEADKRVSFHCLLITLILFGGCCGSFLPFAWDDRANKSGVNHRRRHTY